MSKHLFAWLPVETIKKTWENTTQYGRIPISTILKKHYKASHLALNVKRPNEDVATDTIYYNTPAVDSGVKIAQFFVGKETLVCDVYPLKSTKQFINTLEDQIRERGAPNRLISDCAKVEVIKKVKDILRALFMRAW